MPGLRHLLEALINPFFVLWLSFFLAVLWLYFKQNNRWLTTIGFVFVLLFTVLSTGFFPQYLTKTLENRYKPVKIVQQNIRCVVVLGGGQYNHPSLLAHDILLSASIKRLMEGIRLYRLLNKSKLILSGGGYGSNYGQTEASRMAVLSSWLKIPEKDIQLEQESINTEDQAKLLKKELNDEPFYLVTSATHMSRAIRLFEYHGMNPVPAPTDFTLFWQDEKWQKKWIPNPQNMTYVNVAWHEILGRIWFEIKARAKPL